MTLYLVRHAEAKPLGGPVTTDTARPLTVEGERTARLMGRMLLRVEPRRPLIASSPYLRASSTAALLGEAWPETPVPETWEELTPGVRHKELLSRINRTSASALVLVGHQPDMTDFLAILVADAATEIAMPPASIVCLKLATGLTTSSGRMHWLVTPELVRALAPGL
jgi:phosphohistidine phosphatase